MNDSDFKTKQEVIDEYPEKCKYCGNKVSLRSIKIYWGSWLSTGGYVVDKHFQHSCGHIITTSSQLL